MIGWGLWHWLERRADLVPEGAAMIDGEATTTYRTLRNRVAAAAGAMRAHGVGRGDRVGILSINRSEYIEVLFAAAWLGAIAVPLNWRLTAPELAFQVGDSEPVMLFVDPELRSLAEGVRAQSEARSLGTFIAFDGEAAAPPWAGSYTTLLRHAAAPPDGRFDDPFLIMYTSGTTGRPKGAVLTQSTQLWNAVNIGTAISLTASDVTLNALPMFHTGGIGLLVLPSLHAGATAVIQRRFEPDETVRLIGRHGVTAMLGVPSMYLMLLASEAFGRADLSRVRFSCGGAPCPLTIIEAFRDRGLMFQQGYGLTETAPTCLLVPAGDAFRKAGSAGKATMHAEVRVVDDDGRDVPADGIGEVWTRGPNLFSGYWRRPDATAEAFEDGWFKTGDLARIDAEGFIYIVDRKNDMIISGGENIYPAEVEDILYHHPGVAEAAVIGVPHTRWGEVPHAVVVAKPGVMLSADEVIAFCEGRLARYKIPKSVAFTDALPRNAAGKVLKRLLREQFASQVTRAGTG
ncbi:MAG: acyl-CoA synthetase [Armatimonadota bacterium]